MKTVLGLRLGPGHDTGAALVFESGSELRCVAIAEERLSRKKSSRDFPQRAIQACLDEFNIDPIELGAVVFEKTVWECGTTWCDQVTQHWEWFDAEERRFLSRVGSTPLYYINHHLAHAATAWHPTSWPLDGDPGALLVIDGRGSTWGDGSDPRGCNHYYDPAVLDELGQVKVSRIPHAAETQSVFRAQDRTIERVDVSLRSGIGLFYNWVTEAILGFGHMHAGKSMGLAAYGSSNDRLPPLTDQCLDGIDTDLLEAVLTLQETGQLFLQRSNQEPTDAEYSAAAYWAQSELTKTVRHLAQFAIERTGARRLGYSGGVALNVVANRAIRDELFSTNMIDDMFVQPAASDMGLALGCALHGYYSILGGRLPFQREQVLLGPTHTTTETNRAVEAAGGYKPASLVQRVADLLLEGKIIGWFHGRSEHGPRALGNRSILCWPRPDWMKDHLNLRVKHREAFRPFAPIVRVEDAPEIFDVDYPVPYMLTNTQVRPEFREKIPAVTHADGSGRLQTIDRDHSAILHDLLGEIRARDGVGVLLNTSFNDNGEPIVETAEDAIRCFQSTNIDALVCGDMLIDDSCKQTTHAEVA